MFIYSTSRQYIPEQYVGDLIPVLDYFRNRFVWPVYEHGLFQINILSFPM